MHRPSAETEAACCDAVMRFASAASAQLWREYHDSLLSGWCDQRQRQREREEVEARRQQATAAAGDDARAAVDAVTRAFHDTAGSGQRHHSA